MKRFATCVVLALGFCLPGFAGAQGFPSGPVSLVVPLAPGDAADITARALGEELSKLLNVPVLPVNRPGAGGALGAASVAQAAKDGQTILFTPNSALTIRAVLEAQALTYDPQKDLVPLGVSSRTPSVLVVRGDAPYKTFGELVEFSKKNPGKVRVGHPGPGSAGDLCIRLINVLTGAGLEEVPHKGAAPAILALRGGHIEGVVLALGALSTHMKAGTFRGLASSARIADFAEIPTLRQLGHPEELFGVWFSFLAPAGIPEEARKALAGAVEQAVRSPAISAKLAPLGIVQSYASPEQMSAEIRDETRRVADVARKTGLLK
jgi:tripartite-type tricarboxylate transporter receptor subunit TctC